MTLNYIFIYSKSASSYLSVESKIAKINLIEDFFQKLDVIPERLNRGINEHRQLARYPMSSYHR